MFSLCVWVEGSEPSSPLFRCLLFTAAPPHWGAGGPGGGRASAAGGLAVTLLPVNMHQVAGTQNNTKRDWLGFLFLTSPSKNLCFILAWGQNATTPFCKHCKTISRPNLPWCFNQAAVRYQGQLDAEGLCASMKCSRLSETLWAVVTCVLAPGLMDGLREGVREEVRREWSDKTERESRGKGDKWEEMRRKPLRAGEREIKERVCIVFLWYPVADTHRRYGSQSFVLISPLFSSAPSAQKSPPWLGMGGGTWGHRAHHPQFQDMDTKAQGGLVICL